MYTVYAIYNKQSKKIYIGQTKNLIQRLNIHNKKLFNNSYTSRYPGNWVLIHKEIFATRQLALIREKQLKSYQGRQFIKNSIPG